MELEMERAAEEQDNAKKRRLDSQDAQAKCDAEQWRAWNLAADVAAGRNLAAEDSLDEGAEARRHRDWERAWSVMAMADAVREDELVREEAAREASSGSRGATD
jgi:hypothetical protein